jgi:geranylgeranyl diphosphate synthase type II
LNATAVERVSLAEHLAALRRAVDAALDRWLPTERDCPPTLAAAMRYAVFPSGKRLRPVLVLLAAEACGGSIDVAMPAASAVELVHCYSLVHDDLPAMDDDDLRRGRPTCHVAFGEAMGILTGDALLTLAFDIVARHSATPQLAAESCRELATAAGAAGMVGGQVDDVAWASSLPMSQKERAGRLEARPTATDSLGRLQSIHARKTGAMMLASVRLGGIAARADSSVMAALDGYGRRIGVAFQIADDLLDACGSEARTGKRTGKDGGRGKMTYPGVVGIDESRQLARTLCDEACRAVAILGDRAERLRQLAEFIVERDH